MLFVPVGALVEYLPQQVLRTHLLPYEVYETPFSRHELRLDYYTISEYYAAAPQLLSSFWPYLQLVLLTGLLSVCLALSTYLRRYWFWISQGMFAALLYSCNLHQLRLAGRIDLVPYVAILLPFVLTALQIQRRGAHLALQRRVLAFVGLFALVGLAIGHFSVETEPFLILSHHIYYAQICLTLLFCLVVGHEIPYLLLRISSSAGFGNSGSQFIVIFLLYMAHLIIFFFRNTGYIGWEVQYVDEFVFFAISALSGVLTLRASAHQHSYLLPYGLQRIGFLAWAAFAMATIAYMRASGNDPVGEVFEDGILFGHIGFGIGFFTYILMNFHKPLFQNLAVWRVVYQDMDMPFLVVRLFGLIVIAICYGASQKAAYNHALSGEHMQLANLYAKQKSPIAEHHYQRAAELGYQSHGPNYALGQQAVWSKDYYAAVTYYRASVAKHPSPQGYLNLGNALHELRLPDMAATAWKDGLLQFPTAGHLANNLSYYYLQRSRWDSVAYYVDLAAEQASVNAAALVALEGAQIAELSEAASPAECTNWLAAALQHKQAPTLPLDTSHHRRIHGLAYMHNHALALLRYSAGLAVDSLSRLEFVSHDYAFRHDIRRLRAFAEAAVGHTDTALRLLAELGGEGSRHGGFYAYTAGLWAYVVGGYSRAAAYFQQACRRGYPEGLSIGLQCTAMLPKGQLKQQQLAIWQQLQADTSQHWKYVTDSPFLVLEEDVELASFAESLRSSPRLGLAFVQRLLDEQKASLAAELLQVLPATDSSLQTYAQLLRAECLLAIEDSATLSKKFQTIPKDIPHHEYFRYLLSPDSTAALQLVRTAKEYPFQQQLVLHAAAALQRESYSLLAYDLLLSAVETNPYAAALQKAYAWQAVQLGQEGYAEVALTRLQKLLKKNAYEKVMQKYRALIQQQAEADW